MSKLDRNFRLINSVAATIVYVDVTPVDGSTDFHFSLDEMVHIDAEVQEGLQNLAGLEPDARLRFDTQSRHVSIQAEPWEGAHWPGMNSEFYQGIDAALWREDDRRIYFFKGNQVMRYSSVPRGVDNNYPRLIAEEFSGLPTNPIDPDFAAGIDAALWRESNERIYFLRVIGISASTRKPVPSPRPVSSRISGPTCPPALPMGSMPR